MGSISFGWALVAGKKRSPLPAAGIMAFLTFFIINPSLIFFIFKLRQFPIMSKQRSYMCEDRCCLFD